jgi:hypothetical protein
VSSEAPQLTAGTLVRVRQRTFLVENVRTAPEAAAVVSLACVDDDAQGQRLDVPARRFALALMTRNRAALLDLLEHSR